MTDQTDVHRAPDPGSVRALERESGVALWRQIADRIRQDIVDGLWQPGCDLPGEHALAARFGVNRHTLRAAFVALADEGLVETVKGRGSRVAAPRRYSFPIARRTRFSDGLAGQTDHRHTALRSHAKVRGRTDLVEAMGLPTDPGFWRLDLTASADGRALSVSKNWFRADVCDGIVEAFEQLGSVTRALSAIGIPDYLRRSTDLTARLATAEERELMGLSPGAVILFARAINETPDGKAFQYSETAFAADRVELRVAGSLDP